MITLVTVIALSLAGTIWRLGSESAFLFYPDTYRFLLAATNIRQHGSAAITLGEHGMPYDAALQVTLKAGYPLFIAVLSAFTGDPVAAARLISLLAGLVAIPLAYFIVSRRFASTEPGLIAAALTAFSFTHVAWSGYAMSETLALVLFLACLALFAYRSHHNSNISRDLIAAAFMALAVFTRTEYIMLLPMVLAWMYEGKKRSWSAIWSFMTFFSFSLIILSILLIPLGSFRLSPGIAYFALPISAIALAILVVSSLTAKKGTSRLARFLAAVTIVFGCYLLVQVLVGPKTFGLPLIRELAGWRMMARHDFLIVGLGLAGIAWLLLDHRYHNLGVWLWSSLAIMVMAYLQANSYSFRYTIHYLPPLILGSSLLLSELLSMARARGPGLVTVFAVVFLSALVVQADHSRHAMKGWYYPVSYEQKAASRINQILKNEELANKVLIVARPAEAYAALTGKDGWRIDAKYPFIPYEGGFPVQRPVLLIVDEAARHLTPDFADLAEKRLGDYEIGTFLTGIPYHYGRNRYPETKPVRVYYLTGSILLKAIPDHDPTLVK